MHEPRINGLCKLHIQYLCWSYVYMWFNFLMYSMFPLWTINNITRNCSRMHAAKNLSFISNMWFHFLAYLWLFCFYCYTHDFGFAHGEYCLNCNWLLFYQYIFIINTQIMMMEGVLIARMDGNAPNLVEKIRVHWMMMVTRDQWHVCRRRRTIIFALTVQTKQNVLYFWPTV